ncbi:MAG: CoB--CoM heterodisulfide reductase iron-sulfur subunit A family protein [Bacteroidetes bacterium]|nr:CoB--CoM heterodisulfide reductase iron-sulfur subunit A family protein [Bacteroidota bacterium]
MKQKKVIVIGGGISGMESSTYLTSMGYDVVLIEQKDKLGGKLLKWEKLFPTMSMGKDVVNFLNKGIDLAQVKVELNAKIINAVKEGNIFKINLDDGRVFESDAVLVTTGYDVFDARKKEEYGYGIYDNVITSAELEEKFLSGNDILTNSGKVPKKVGFVHCVGSRDEKVGNVYCSKVCCVTAVKQAIEIKEKIPGVDAYCFYMDLRMFGMHFEALYKQAQEKWAVNFIRGRLSEACENMDGSIMVKVEDTLAGKPLRMNVDLLVLMVGIVPSVGTKTIGKMMGLNFGPNGFFKSLDQHSMTTVSNVPGVFFAGCCVAPRTINNVFVDARAAALMTSSYLEGYDIEKRIQEK